MLGPCWLKVDKVGLVLASATILRVHGCKTFFNPSNVDSQLVGNAGIRARAALSSFHTSPPFRSQTDSTYSPIKYMYILHCPPCV